VVVVVETLRVVGGRVRVVGLLWVGVVMGVMWAG